MFLKFSFVLIFLWPLLWSNYQSSWLQIQIDRVVFDSWSYQTFWVVVDLERGPLSLVSTIEELLERKSSCSGLENREYGVETRHANRATTFIRKS
jgi:hypothetical protein